MMNCRDLYRVHGVQRYTIYTLKNIKNPPWIRKVNSRLMVDVEYLLRIKSFEKAIQHEAEEAYWALQLKQKDVVIAASLATVQGTTTQWLSFINLQLFRANSKALTDTRVSAKLVKFVRILRRLKEK